MLETNANELKKALSLINDKNTDLKKIEKTIKQIRKKK